MSCTIPTDRGTFHLTDYQEKSLISQLIFNKPGNNIFFIPVDKTCEEYESYVEKKKVADSKFRWPVHYLPYGIRV